MKTAARFENFPAYIPIEPFEVLSARLARPAEAIVKLDANENAYGPSPLARKALAELDFPHIYPDPESRALRKGLSDFCGVPVENLLAGAGADELIDLLLRVLLEPDDCVINCPPTFGMYPFDTLLNAGQVIEIPRLAGPDDAPGFSLDLEAIQAAVETRRPKVLFITTPNNPDGSLTPPDEIRRLLDLPLLVVIDEAYIEFTRSGGRLGEQLSFLREAPRRENLVVLRTFSKWAGLAGLRVGYGAFPNWMLPALWKAKQPYNVNVAASAAALASLQDLDYLADNVERIRQEREELFGALQNISFLRPYPSQANFILCQVIGRPAKELQDELASQGILVRYYNNALLKDFIRISVGRPQDSAALLGALQELESNQKLASRASIPLTSRGRETCRFRGNLRFPRKKTNRFFARRPSTGRQARRRSKCVWISTAPAGTRSIPGCPSSITCSPRWPCTACSTCIFRQKAICRLIPITPWRM